MKKALNKINPKFKNKKGKNNKSVDKPKFNREKDKEKSFSNKNIIVHNERKEKIRLNKYK